MSAPITDSFETLESLKSLLDKELKPILVSYSQHTPKTLTKLKRAIKAGELEQIQSIAHLLKGSSSNLGFMQFSANCAALEQAAKNNAEITQLAELSEQLIKDAESLNDRIEQFIIDNF